MVMSKVTLNVSAPTSIQPQNPNADSNFSDVLGGVSTERRQAGLQGSSQGGKEGEFRYTEQRQSSDGSKAAERQPVGGGSPAVSEKTVEAAENLLEEAVSTLKKLITEGEELPEEDEILKLLMELIAKQKKQSDKPDSEDEASAIELLMSLLTNMSAENAEENEPVMPIATPQEPITAVSEKSGEAAMLTSSIGVTANAQPEEQLPEATEETATVGFAEALTAETETVTAEDNAVTSEITAEAQFIPNEAVIEELPKPDIPEAIVSEAPVAPEARTEEAKPESALEKLNDILAKAKEELGLTKATVRTVEAETQRTEAAETVAPRETTVKFSSDKVDELNSILGRGEKEEAVVKETENTVHTEMDNAVHMAAELIDRTAIAESRLPEQEIPVESVQRPPEVQTADEILSRIRTMESDRTEFTMVLNPESLGRITVKLVLTGEKVSVDISAENPETRQLLESRAASMQSMLKTNGVELESYKVVTREEESQQAMQQDNYDGSSKNPYSGQQQNRNGEDDDDNSFYELLQSI